jgi:putative DNA primase/helicase
VVQIPKEDRKKDFDAILQAEIEGILAWAVKGCLDWQQRGDLEPPPEVINATKEYQEESDVIGRFIAEKCVKLTRAEVRATALWSAYKDWCEQHGETWVKQTAFGRKLTEDGFGKRESHGLIYTGIGLRSEDQE